MSFLTRLEIVLSESTQPPVFQTETSNTQIRERWKLPENADPATMALEQLDPGNSEWFVANKELEVFDRLRAEAPVHLTEHSQFGPYWSLSRFEDVKYVDTHHHLFFFRYHEWRHTSRWPSYD